MAMHASVTDTSLVDHMCTSIKGLLSGDPSAVSGRQAQIVHWHAAVQLEELAERQDRADTQESMSAMQCEEAVRSAPVQARADSGQEMLIVHVLGLHGSIQDLHPVLVLHGALAQQHQLHILLAVIRLLLGEHPHLRPHIRGKALPSSLQSIILICSSPLYSHRLYLDLEGASSSLQCSGQDL